MFWEYRIEEFRPQDDNTAIAERLNALGAERWEVVALDRDGRRVWVLLRRQKGVG